MIILGSWRSSYSIHFEQQKSHGISCWDQRVWKINLVLTFQYNKGHQDEDLSSMKWDLASVIFYFTAYTSYKNVDSIR